MGALNPLDRGDGLGGVTRGGILILRMPAGWVVTAAEEGSFPPPPLHQLARLFVLGAPLARLCQARRTCDSGLSWSGLLDVFAIRVV